MDNKVNYTALGLFVIALSVMMIVVLFWLSSSSHDKDYKTYVTYVKEDVSGLSVQSPVRFNGVKVGYVDHMELDKSNPQLVKLVLHIEEGTPISTSTIATLLPMGVTGVIYVGLKANTQSAPILRALPGNPFPIIPSRPSLLMQLGNVLPVLTKNLESISQSVTRLLSDQNRTAIDATLQHVSVITGELAKNAHRLNTISANLQTTLKNTAKASAHFPDLVQQFSKTLHSMKHTTNLIDAMAGRSSLMIDNLNAQLVPVAQTSVQQLNQLIRRLNHFSTSLNQNPSMLIRGKYPDQPGPGE